MGSVEAALQGLQQAEQQSSASPSPRSRIPRAAFPPALAQLDGGCGQPQYRGASPTKIPLPAPLTLPAPVQSRRPRYEDEGENGGRVSVPTSPDKEHLAGSSAAGWRGGAALALRGSVENLPRYE